MTRSAAVVVVAVALGFAVSGCKKETTIVPAPAALPAAAQPAAPAAQPAAGSAAAGTLTGIAECDDYLQKYVACIEDKVPEAARREFRRSIEQSRAALTHAAANPQAKAATASGCLQAKEATRQAMQAYGCQW